MRIIVAGRIRFAGDAQTCAALLTEAAGLIRDAREEEGCVAYDWGVDPIEPGLVNVFEEWESPQALLRHFAAPPYARMRDHLMAQEITESQVQVYSVAGVEPVYGEDGVVRSEIFGVRLA